MIRSELLNALAKDNPGLKAEEVEQVVDIFFDEIGQRLAEGGRVELRGFGAFSTRERDAIPALASRSRSRRSACPISAPARKCAASSTTTNRRATFPEPAASLIAERARPR